MIINPGQLKLLESFGSKYIEIQNKTVDHYLNKQKLINNNHLIII